MGASPPLKQSRGERSSLGAMRGSSFVICQPSDVIVFAIEMGGGGVKPISWWPVLIPTSAN
jgi:hypothetical protein